MEDTLEALRSNRPVSMTYDTTFFVDWPRHLGGGASQIVFVGGMILVPMMDGR